MPRARNIKPSFFDNEDLPRIDALGRLLFIGLWTLADKKGRLEDRPRKIKGQLFAYEECNIEQYLTQLATLKFITRYRVAGIPYIEILNFVKHQSPHHTEKESSIPEPEPITDIHGDITDIHESTCVEIPLIPDSLIPDSLIPEKTFPEKESGKKSPKVYPMDFEKFWIAYPKARRCEKPDAFKAWKIACQSNTPEKLYDSLQSYLKAEECKEGFAPYPAKWLRKERYLEEFVQKKIDYSEMLK